MGKKKIIAYFMHESEQAIAQQKMSDQHGTDSYVLGEIEEGDIPELEKKGLIVQRIDEAAEAEPPAAELQRSMSLQSVRSRPRRRAQGFTRAAPAIAPPAMATAGVSAPPVAAIPPAAPAAAAIPEPKADVSRPNFYLLRIRGPLIREWRIELEKSGVKLNEKVGRGLYTVKLGPHQVGQVSSLPFVASVSLYGEEESGIAAGSIAAETATAGPPPASAAAQMLAFDIRLHEAEGLNEVQNALHAMGISIAGASGRKIRIYLMDDANLQIQLNTLNRMPEVELIERYVEPRLHNDVARVLLGVDAAPGGNPATGLSQTGKDQVVGVADTGLDDQHPDFLGRIIGLVGLGRPGDATDPHGHGTHVAGSVLGNGAASGGRYRGVAPEAKLFFQSLMDGSGRLSGLPLSLGDLFEEAYQAGARIHNNSWGAMVDSEYTMNSLEVDEFVAKRRDMLIVISAGNEGQAAALNHARPGFVEWLSIGSPASCKNALTVGASRSSRNSGGYSGLKYGQAWPNDFPQPPIAGELISGDADALAAFSSRGPCTDHRIKPDVVAPGTDILSAKSSKAPLRNFWGAGPAASYAYMGGTSMAAPLTAGCAALVREYYEKARNHSPSAALLKATLINSTKKLTAQDAVADFADLPNMHQGFGCIHMPWAIPNPLHPDLKLEFHDTWNVPNRSFTYTGQRFRYQFSIAGGQRLSICLVWTDAPGRALQNNLNLIVQRLADGQKWPGNERLPMSLAPVDQDNNVELVRLDNPTAGDYMIQVFASNLLTSEQDFALVVAGKLTTALTPV